MLAILLFSDKQSTKQTLQNPGFGFPLSFNSSLIMADGLGGWIDCQGSSMKMSEKEKAQIKKAFSNGYT
jgi:hypothetical protein